MAVFDKSNEITKSHESQWNTLLKKMRLCETETFFLNLKAAFYSVLFILFGLSITFHPFHFFSDNVLNAESITTNILIILISALFALMIFDLVRDTGWKSRITSYVSFFGVLTIAIFFYSYKFLFLNLNYREYTIFSHESIVLGSYVLGVAIIFLTLIVDLMKTKKVKCSHSEIKV